MKTVEIKQKPNEEVIESLENSLKQAKEGNLQSFMMVKRYINGSGWAHQGLSADDVPTLLGEIMLMAVQLSNTTMGIDSEDINY